MPEDGRGLRQKLRQGALAVPLGTAVSRKQINHSDLVRSGEYSRLRIDFPPCPKIYGTKVFPVFT